jgi:hypothetical protein
VPHTTIVESSPTEPAQRLAEGRRARFGYLFAFHIVLLGAAGRSRHGLSFTALAPVVRDFPTSR